MKILHYYEDRDIDVFIRRYGITRLAKRVGMSASYLSQALKKGFAVPEEKYKKIKEVIDNDKI